MKLGLHTPSLKRSSKVNLDRQSQENTLIRATERRAWAGSRTRGKSHTTRYTRRPTSDGKTSSSRKRPSRQSIKDIYRALVQETTVKLNYRY
jgi:hypothetical protein